MDAPKALRFALATALVGGAMAALAPSAAQGAVGTASVVNRWSTSTGAWATKPSPDPSGITYRGGQLVISDGEVDEIPALYEGANIFYASLTGAPDPAKAWTTLPRSDEPTGISTFGNLFVVSDDTGTTGDAGTRGVYLFNPGSDGRWVSGQDPNPLFFPSGTFGTDPEDVTVDSDLTSDGHIVVISGANREVVDYSAGPDGNFATTSDNVVTHFDVLQYGARDPEGIEYEPVRNTLLVLDHTSNTIYELSRQGALLNTVPLPAGVFTKAAGMTLAPGTNGGNNLYVVDRGLDNNQNPGENDGQVVELRVTLPPLPGGGGGDTTAPTVTTVRPTANQTGVLAGTNIVATFNERVQGVTTSTFTLTGPNGAVAAPQPRSNTAGTVWTLNPTNSLPAGTYTATLTSGIRDMSNNAFGGFSWTFTVGSGSGGGGDTVAPTVTARTPTATTGVGRSVNVTVTFSERVRNVTATTFYLTGPTGTVAAVLSNPNGGNRWVLNPNATLAARTTYTATVVGGPSGVEDLAGNDLASNVTWSFTTGA